MCVNILPASPQRHSLHVHYGASAANDTHYAIDFLSKLNIRFYAFNKIASRKIQLPLQASRKLIKRARIIMQASNGTLNQGKGRFGNVTKTSGIRDEFSTRVILLEDVIITK